MWWLSITHRLKYSSIFFNLGLTSHDCICSDCGSLLLYTFHLCERDSGHIDSKQQKKNPFSFTEIICFTWVWLKACSVRWTDFPEKNLSAVAAVATEANPGDWFLSLLSVWLLKGVFRIHFESVGLPQFMVVNAKSVGLHVRMDTVMRISLRKYEIWNILL